MKIVASRLADGNKIFPPSITLEETGLTVKLPGFFNGKNMFLLYSDISSVTVNTRLIGYSTIHMNAQGSKFTAHGFTKKEVEKIKATIEANKNKAVSSETLNKSAAVSSEAIGHNNPKTKSGIVGFYAETMKQNRKTLESLVKEEKDEKAQIESKIEEISQITFGTTSSEIEERINQLISMLASKPKKKIKNVLIEKVEYGILKLGQTGANKEVSYFEDKLAPYKKKNIFGF
jgi:hypothetical protein